MPVTRDAFLYMDPKPPERRFAQCGVCRWFTPARELCAVIGIKVDVKDSCGLYVYGLPTEKQTVQHTVSAHDAGYTTEPVRCENCTFFRPSQSGCHLYYQINRMLPDVFKLEVKVDAHGCCNAQTPKRGEGKRTAGDLVTESRKGG